MSDQTIKEKQGQVIDDLCNMEMSARFHNQDWAEYALTQLLNEAREKTKEELYEGGEKRFVSMLLEHGVEYTEEFQHKDTVTFRINRKTIDKYRKGELTPGENK